MAASLSKSLEPPPKSTDLLPLNFFGGSQADLDGIEMLIGRELAEQIE